MQAQKIERRFGGFGQRGYWPRAMDTLLLRRSDALPDGTLRGVALVSAGVLGTLQLQDGISGEKLELPDVGRRHGIGSRTPKERTD